MKRIAALLLSLALLFSLAACGQSETVPAGTQAPAAAPESEAPAGTPESAPDEAAPAEQPASGKVLVVYFSATNNTEAVAQTIASATGGDLFELLPTVPYTSDDLDWTDRDSRVSKEHDDPSLRSVELENAVPDNWESYDTVFVG